MKRFVIYSRGRRDEGFFKLCRTFSVLLQKHRVYVMKKFLNYRPRGRWPCGWHGDVLCLALYVTVLGPFETSGAVEFATLLPDRVALVILEGSWSAEDVFREFCPFDVGIACLGPPLPDVRRYV